MNQSNPATAPHPLDFVFSAHTVLSTDYPPIEFTVPGLVPEGLTLLVASPKIGKSWFVLGLAVACVTGGYALGSIKVEQRPVFYLALEDGPRRLKDRLNMIGVSEPRKDFYRLKFLLDLTYTSVDSAIRAYLAEHGAQKPLIIVDTLGRARGVHTGNDAYGKDYNDLARLKRHVDDYPGSSLIIVHHTNKRGSDGDFLGAISGTQGLAGAADSTLMISRDRGKGQARLQVTSREIPEGEYAISFENGAWSLVGNDLKEAAAAARESEQAGVLGDLQTRILEHFNKYPEPHRPKDIAVALGEDPEKVGTYIRRLHEMGRIQRTERGKYAALPEPGLLDEL